MPEFEHFPVQEIMKEGVEGQGEGGADCAQTNVPFGSFDDWGLEVYEDHDNDYGDDYVQPTKKPLIFKELMNTKPLSTRGYESKRYQVVFIRYPINILSLFQTDVKLRE